MMLVARSEAFLNLEKYQMLNCLTTRPEMLSG